MLEQCPGTSASLFGVQITSMLAKEYEFDDIQRGEFDVAVTAAAIRLRESEFRVIHCAVYIVEKI